MLFRPTDGVIVSRTPVDVEAAFQGKVEVERIDYLVDELRVVGFIVKPLSAHQQPVPVMIYNRGGNREYGKIDSERLRRLCSYAARGYVVLASQYRGNDGGEGREEFGGADVRDVFALSRLADTLPEADAARKVMVGFSRGGMMTYICIRQRIDILAAAVVGAPADLLRQPQPFPMDQIHADLIGDRVQDADRFHDRSALCWPDQLNIPLLIMHGENDDRVDVQDSIELAQRLSELGKEHKFVSYPGGDHRLSKFEAARDQELFNWFGKYLGRPAT